MRLKPLRRAAINMDDPYGAAIRDVAACPVITYGTESSNDIYGVDIELTCQWNKRRNSDSQGALPVFVKTAGPLQPFKHTGSSQLPEWLSISPWLP